ncbi:hypothetical protein Bp8pS_192 [Bacillus phage vB_BpuM-BpSp]|nr:hypothetical protein Bp8pS_192 [Bacillus phage vB_BpuM-BpSp]
MESFKNNSKNFEEECIDLLIDDPDGSLLLNILLNFKLSDEFLKLNVKNYRHNHWIYLSVFQKPSIDFTVKYFEEMNRGNVVIGNKNVNIEIIYRMADTFNESQWDLISERLYLPKEFLIKYANKINWNTIYERKDELIGFDEEVEVIYKMYKL